MPSHDFCSHRAVSHTCNLAAGVECAAVIDEAAAGLAYVWRAHQRPLTIALRLDVVDRLGLAVQEASQAIPRRGLEIGAILLGTATRSHGETFIEIENFDFLESEHAVGPSYLLSAADRHALVRRLRQHRSSRQLSVVGFCRSHTRKNFAITMEDTALMADYFAESSMILLLIHAIPGEPPRGGYYFWEGRAIRTGRPRGEFPFRSAVLMSGDYELSQAVPSPPSGHPRVVPSLVTLPRQLAAAASRICKPLPWLRSLARAHLRTPRIPRLWPAWRGAPARSIHLLLRVFRMAVRRRALPWIPAAVVLAGAIAGGLFYHGSTRTVASTVSSALHRLPAAPPTAAVPQPLPPEPAPHFADREPPPAASLPASPVVVAAVPLFDHPESHLAPSTGSRDRSAAAAPLRAFDSRTLSAPLPPPVPASLPDAPKVPPALAGDLDPLDESQIVRFEPPQIPDPLVTVSIEPLAVSHRAESLARRSPTGAPAKHARYTPPALTHREPLDLPPELRRRIGRTTTINIKLYLDQTGKVQFAELLSDGTGRDRDLASMAVFTSRHYQFLPARLGDEPVPAEVLLHYRFASATPAP